jgi:signal peptidase I
VAGLAYWFVARRRSPVSDTTLSPLRTVLLAAAGVPLFIFVQLVLIFTSTFVMQPATVAGRAMTPTLADGAHVVVNKMSYRLGQPRRGEIVMLRYPLKPERTFVLRVIAEEGDAVQIKDGRVSINQSDLNEDYVPADGRSHDNWGPAVVPEGHLFVMGDRRNNSSDSRHWGFVPRAYILGRVIAR